MKWYSAFATVYLIIHADAKAGVVYSDIEPDIVLDEALEFTILDLDENGTIDFGFLNTDFTTYVYPYGDRAVSGDCAADPGPVQLRDVAADERAPRHVCGRREHSGYVRARRPDPRTAPPD